MNKEGQDKTWIINDESDTMSSLFIIWNVFTVLAKLLLQAF